MCSVAVTSIRHESRLSVQSGTEWRPVGINYVDRLTHTDLLYTKDIEYLCRGKKETTWRGTTRVVVVFEARTYSGQANTRAQRLACGATRVPGS